MATTLILSTDEVISSLLGQLSELTGNIPKYRAVDESLIVSINRIRPDVVLLDARFGAQKLKPAIAAASSEGASTILFGGSYSSGELKSVATTMRIPYLPLPTDLRVFRLLIQQASGEKEQGIHPAIMSAISSVSRARALVEQLESICTETKSLRTATSVNKENCSKKREQLRGAVMDYARILREAGIPRERAVTLIENAVLGGMHGAISDPAKLRRDMDAAAKWCSEEYQVA